MLRGPYANERGYIVTTRLRQCLLALLAAVLVGVGTLLGRAFWPREVLAPAAKAPSAMPSSVTTSRPAASANSPLPFAPPRAERSPGAVDVVLISLDTVRTDDLEPYGASLRVSPFLARLAREGVTFKHAYSTSSWTAPAMYSLITGLYPREHGIVESTIVGTEQPSQPSLPEDATTLAERLKAHGYSTFGVSTNFHLARRFGFAQGFDQFVGDGFHFKPFPRVAVESMRAAILDSAKYFLWVHYFDAHFPYLERAPWFDEWNDSSFTTFDEIGVNAALSDYWRDKGQPTRPYFPHEDVTLLGVYLASYLLDPIRLHDAIVRLTADPTDITARTAYSRYLRAAYRSELRAIDADIEFVFKRLGIDEQTLVIVVADHGEEFFDHGRLGHRLDSLHEELISVPLIVRLPFGAHKGKVVEQPVSLVDVVPSVLSLVDAKPFEGLSGRSITELLDGTSPAADRDIVAELTHLDGSEHRCLIRYPWKYVHHYREGRGELYDLASDPQERNDLSTVDDARASDMRRRLDGWVTQTSPRWTAPAASALEPDDLQKLRALGYTAAP